MSRCGPRCHRWSQSPLCPPERREATGRKAKFRMARCATFGVVVVVVTGAAVVVVVVGGGTMAVDVGAAVGVGEAVGAGDGAVAALRIGGC